MLFRLLPLITALVLGGACLRAEEKPPANFLLIIAPYKKDGMWVFDDPRVGLRQEPFVAGADRIMDLLSTGLPHAEEGFTLIFSAQSFPGSEVRFTRGRAERGGFWYSWPEKGVEGWLCPALFKYFPAAPPEIHVQARAKAKP